VRASGFGLGAGILAFSSESFSGSILRAMIQAAVQLTLSFTHPRRRQLAEAQKARQAKSCTGPLAQIVASR